MKNILLIATCFFTINTIYAQTEIKIEFINETKVILNEIEINKSTTFDIIKKILGEPVIYKEYITGKINYHYNQFGISIHTFEGNLTFIGANFNWDGDKTFPNTTYSGTLKIDGVKFDKNSNNASIKNIANLEFLTIIPGLYMSKPKTDKKNTFVIIGFKDDLVTQIGFEFH